MVKVGVVVVLVELESLKKVVQEEMDQVVENEAKVLDHQAAVSQSVNQVDVCVIRRKSRWICWWVHRFLWRIIIVFI